jgi:hypothetical protein
MTILDEMQNSRIDSIDSRLRSVEQAVVELATMAKWIKYAVVVMAGSLGFDLSGMVQ